MDMDKAIAMAYRCEICNEKISNNLAFIIMHTIKCFTLSFIELMRLKEALRVKDGK